MRTWARLQMKTGHRPVYRYYFSRKPPGTEGGRLGAFHALDLQYVFGNFTFPFPWDDADRKLSDLIISYWTNFAKTGAPNGVGVPAWPAYNPAEDNVIEFGNKVSVRTHVNQAGLDFFDAYHPVQALFHPEGGGAQ
jgi:para-nitrobenzyl esterase